MNESPLSLLDLDPEQRAAVLTKERRVLVVAGPGSGKTRVLVTRYALLKGEGRSPLALTFTNRAAGVMKERLKAMGLTTKGVATFHSFCLGLLKDERPAFTLIGRAGQARILSELGVTAPMKTLDRFSRLAAGLPNDDSGLRALYRSYRKALAGRSALDLDDLITETIKLLEEDGETRRRYLPLYSDILVDEFQDINQRQARLVSLLSTNSNLFCIGDPDQSVYAFRGANLDGFLSFERDYPGARIFELPVNYRSLSRLVRASAAVISHNSERAELVPSSNGEGGSLTLVEAGDRGAEERFIIGEIERLMGGFTSLTAGRGERGDEPGGLRFSDFAVLARTNHGARSVAEAFERVNIPFSLLSRKVDARIEGFLERLREGSPGSDVGLLELVRVALEEAGISEALSAELASLADATAGHAGEVEEFIERVLLREPEDSLGIEADRVTISTLHMSKGLEFDTVFIAGVEKGLLPYERGGVVEDMEEERRLFYVGMTRAARSLYIISARARLIYGENRAQSPSPFISEIPENLARNIKAEKKKRKRKAVQKGLFD